MAAVLRMTISLLPFCLPWMATAVTVPVMRHEQAGSSLSQASSKYHVSASGQVSVKASSAEVDLANDWGEDTSGNDYCNADFPLGNDKTNDCAAADHHEIIDMADCRQAAHEAGCNITLTGHNWTVPYDYFMKHPQGCFTQECHSAAWLGLNPQGQCYFYNPSPTTPNAIDAGRPVCKRDKIVNGTDYVTEPMSAHANGGCPTGYEAIRTEAKCREFAGCLGHCSGSPMLINHLNASLYDEFPKYCFINDESHLPYDKCVYWNEPRPGMIDPTKAVGRPLCNVSEITHFPPKQSLLEGM